MARQKATQTRNRLLEASFNALRAHGINGLTLDAVAREAQVSKGGLLHHFPSKEALIEAMLRALFADFDERAVRYADQEAEGPGRWLRAYVRATFDEEAIPLELASLLLGSISENPHLLALIQEDHLRWRERLLNDGVPVGRALVVRQAADAYWSDRLLGMAPDETLRAHLIDELIRLTYHVSTGLEAPTDT